MSPRQARISWGLFAGILGIVLTLTIADAQNKDQRSVEELIPASTVLFIGHDGAELHKAAWEKTAACEAMYDSGMMAVFDKLVNFLNERTEYARHRSRYLGGRRTPDDRRGNERGRHRSFGRRWRFSEPHHEYLVEEIQRRGRV